MTTLSASDLVNVSVQVTSTPPQAPSFSGMLIVGQSTKLSLGQRLVAVTKDSYQAIFAVTDPEYTAAAKAFSQSPAPSLVYIGRRVETAQAGELVGAPLPAVATLDAITAGAFDITVDSTLLHVTGLNLAGLSLANIAAAVQTKLQAGLAGTLCALDPTGAFLIVTSPTTGITSQVSFASAVVADTTTCGLLGLSSVAGAQRVVGIAAEATIGASLAALAAFSAAWYSFTTTSDTTQADMCAAADWAEANQRPYAPTTNSPASYATPTSGDTDIAGYAFRMGYSYTFVTYATGTLDAGASALARIATVDYTQKNAVIDLFGQTLPGVSPESILEPVRLGLLAKNCNAYLSFGGVSMYYKGNMASGRAVDEVLGLVWQAAQIENEVFAQILAGHNPQTDDGVHNLVIACESACKKGVTNGLLAPGRWPATAMSIGNIKPGDWLSEGFYVYAASVDDQSVSDRASRIAPPISIIARGAGALRGAAIVFNFVR